MDSNASIFDCDFGLNDMCSTLVGSSWCMCKYFVHRSAVSHYEANLVHRMAVLHYEPDLSSAVAMQNCLMQLCVSLCASHFVFYSRLGAT